MKNLVLIILILITSSSPLLGCSCMPINIGTPKNNPNREIRTLGTGYQVLKNNQIIFQFLSCYNRPGCKDLVLTKDTKDSNLRFPPRLEVIYTNFDSFEDALLFDSKENKLRIKRIAQKAKEPKIKYNFCYCPEPEFHSILENNLNPELIEQFTKKIKPEIHPDLEECGHCDNLEPFVGIDRYRSPRLTGSFSEEKNQLFFNYKTKKNERKIKINQNYKCAFVIKQMLNQPIEISAESDFSIANESIEEINLCKAKISPLNILNDTAYTEEETLKKIFPKTTKCASPEFNILLSKAKTIFYGRFFYDTSRIGNRQLKDGLQYFLEIKSILPKIPTTGMRIYDHEFIKHILETNGESNLSFIFLSLDDVKVTETNVLKLQDLCNSIILLPGFKRSQQFFQKYQIK